MPRLPLLAVLLTSSLLLSGCSILGSSVDDASEYSDADAPAVEEDDDFGTVEIYDVLEDGSLSPEATGTTLEVWDLFREIATPDFAAEVLLQYRVGDAPDSDTLAYVYQDEDPDYWILAANLATAEDRDLLVATLIHEYAHILTLSTDEFDEAGTCAPEEEMAEGCPAPDSAIAGFRDRFWAGYDDAPAVDNDDEDVAYEFYLAHEDDFVSDYAATNLVEDVAESFMTYVLEESAEGSGVVAQKLQFFDEYPELAAIRERIRADLGL
ncbi:NADH:ubiquinone oxidoreductase subunit 4 (chain M) [Pseudolysinimonas sp.]|jgi:hypothetical protein|uniref:NADH:ubiquinone oxidoreductase subunit 4 (chain M) n=1 Tax=Pseudolysinimonas sp. TaxID=2680009 RepID=UPI0037842F9B